MTDATNKPPFPKWDGTLDSSVPANIPESGSWESLSRPYSSGNLPSIFRTGWAEKIGGWWAITLSLILMVFTGVGILYGKIPGEFGLWMLVTGLYPIASGYTTWLQSHKTRVQSQYRTEFMVNSIEEAQKHITHEVKRQVDKAIELQPPRTEEKQGDSQ